MSLSVITIPWGSLWREGETPGILNLDIKWKWVVCFTLQFLSLVKEHSGAIGWEPECIPKTVWFRDELLSLWHNCYNIYSTYINIMFILLSKARLNSVSNPVPCGKENNAFPIRRSNVRCLLRELHETHEDTLWAKCWAAFCSRRWYIQLPLGCKGIVYLDF